VGLLSPGESKELSVVSIGAAAGSGAVGVGSGGAASSGVAKLRAADFFGADLFLVAAFFFGAELRFGGGRRSTLFLFAVALLAFFLDFDFFDFFACLLRAAITDLPMDLIEIMSGNKVTAN
jgi:hypothetical protein